MIVAAITSFAVMGGPIVRIGEMFDDQHPMVRRHPTLFVVPPHHTAATTPRVEQATRAPGETSTARRKPAAKTTRKRTN